MAKYNFRLERDARWETKNKKFSMFGLPMPDDFYFHEGLGSAVRCHKPISMNYYWSVEAANAQNYVASYDYQCRYVEDVIEFFRSHHRKYWNFYHIKEACNALRLAALRADRMNYDHETGMTNGQEEPYIKKAAICMEMLFKFCSEDRGTRVGFHKSQGLLIPLNHILNIFTSLEMYDECRTIIKIALPQVIENKFCMPLMVLFRFYAGLLAALERNYDDALQHLNYAYINCNLNNYSRVRMILIYLLPLEIILGCHILTQHIMVKYDLPFYWNLAVAVRQGDIQEFRAITETYVECFNKKSLSVFLGDLTDLVYVNVFKKVRMARGCNIIPIWAFIHRLEAIAPKEKFEYSEVVYLIGSLIFKNKIRGYVSYDRGVVVLCQNDPFPRVTNYQYPATCTHYYY